MEDDLMFHSQYVVGQFIGDSKFSFNTPNTVYTFSYCRDCYNIHIEEYYLEKQEIEEYQETKRINSFAIQTLLRRIKDDSKTTKEKIRLINTFERIIK